MKDILINVFFILLLLLITQFILDWQKKKLKRKSKQWIIYLSSLTGIIFCMTFSISFNGQYIFDLRSVPQIIGSLYGGPVVSIGLYVSMLIYRALLGLDSGLVGALFNHGLLAIVLCIISARFLQLEIRGRILISLIMIGLQIMFSYFVFVIFIPSGMPLTLFWQAAPIKLVTIVFIVLTLEGCRRYYRLRNQLVGFEKMEIVHHLSASISHEVRNGLTSTKGFLQLLNEDECDPKRKQYIRIALDELDRTESIIRDFLMFAKPAPIQMKMVDLDKLINNTVALLEPLANMHSIEIRKHLESSKVMCDEGLIQQSLINIFKNAIEAMPDGGILDIQLRTTHFENIIIVQDTGVGMSEEQIERLGTPYYSTKGQNGTGLGMMVAFRLIKELSGNISIASEVGKGTTFTIKLPRKTTYF